jgi:energy-coupling factor transporter ATP-binding protein EcfA2
MVDTLQKRDTGSDGRFATLRLKNVRCFDETEIVLDPRVTVIIGENGAGKTTVAEVMASLSYGADEGLRHFPLRHGKRTGHIALFDTNRKTPAALWRHGGKRPVHERLPDNRYLFAYGRYRRVNDPDAWDANGPDPLVSATGITLLDELAHGVLERRTTTLSRPDGRLLRDLSRYLVAIYEARSFDPGMETIWERLQRSLPALQQSLERVEMVRGETAYIPMIIRRGVRLGLNELSDGYQAILVIMFDLILRYAYLFSTLNDPLEGPATVIIDEIDLHLHVRWQRTVLRQLTALFSGTQFVVTTHSPAVVQAAIDDGHAIIVLRERDGAVQALRLSSRARNRLRYAAIGSLFVETLLFGADSRYSVQVQADEEEVRRLRRKVETGIATEADRKRLFALLNHLEELMAAEEERRGEGPFMSEMARLQRAFLQDLATELDES